MLGDAAARDERRGETEESRRERVRAGLVALLGFFDDEPRLGRVLLLGGPDSAPATASRRRRVYQVLGELFEEGAGEPNTSDTRAPSRVSILELVLGGVFSVISDRISDPDRGPLVELAPSLMAFIETSYLGRAADGAGLDGAAADGNGGDRRSRAAQRPVRATYRTACVLQAISSAPRSSNREIAQAAGLSDEGQTSKLLGRLESRGAIENVGLGAACGEPNQWLLTPYGRSIVKAIGPDFALGAVGRERRRVRGAAS